jgi:hypothetical protein
MLIKDINPDAQSYELSSDLFFYKSTANCIIKDRDAIKLMVDLPCLEACEYLFDCNILTTTSTANKNDISSGCGDIGINYDSLSDENKKIYQMLVDRNIIKPYGEHETGRGLIAHDFLINIPMDETTTCEDFSKRLMEIVSLFQPQELTYGSFTRQDMEKMAQKSLERNPYVIIEEDGEVVKDGRFIEDFITPKYGDNIDINQLIDECNELIYHFYHDEEKDTYWLSKELYDKAVQSRNIKR